MLSLDHPTKLNLYFFFFFYYFAILILPVEYQKIILKYTDYIFKPLALNWAIDSTSPNITVTSHMYFIYLYFYLLFLVFALVCLHCARVQDELSNVNYTFLVESWVKFLSPPKISGALERKNWGLVFKKNNNKTTTNINWKLDQINLCTLF